MTVKDIARICHEANKALCESVGDFSQVSWSKAKSWQQASAIAGVEFALNNPSASPSAQHEAWSQDKINDGWIYGEVKDTDAKTHPCLVPFSELPSEQQAKDYLFRGIVHSLAKFVDE